MSKSILKQLYDGEIYPAENILPKCEEYGKTEQEISGIMEQLKNKLSEDQSLLERLGFLENEMSTIYSFESFSYGFQLAMMLMIETFHPDNELAKSE